MIHLRFYIVDCFAEENDQGNPLLVVLADHSLSDARQQNIAKEINFSETAFILSDKQENGGYDVRIWTPNAGEVPFAGHPTLGTAYVIRTYLEEEKCDPVLLNLKAGQIPVFASGETLTMRQNAPVFGEKLAREEIAEIYGMDVREIREDIPVQWVSTGLEAVIVPLKSRETLSALTIDREKFRAYLKRHPRCYCTHLFFVDMGEGVLAVRCLLEDFREDPATGSACGALTGYLLEYDCFGSLDISCTVVQGEDMGRTSILRLHGAHTDGEWLIEVGGKCHTVAMGAWE